MQNTQVANKTEIDLMKYIFQKIKEHKLAPLFWENQKDIVNPDIIHPVTFEFIEQKLKKELYKDKRIFLLNLKLCFENVKNGCSTNLLKYAAACEFYNDFEKLVSSLDSPTFPLSVPLTASTEQFIKSNERPGTNYIKEATQKSQQPGSVLFEELETAESGEEIDHTKLMRDIGFCTTAGLSMRVVSYMRNLQSETVIVGKELLLKTKNLTPENLRKLRKYVTRILRDAATGKIEAYNRPYGAVIAPVHIISNN